MSENRKRPLDGDDDNNVSKKSNQGSQGSGSVQLKVLIPSIAAGAVIGKGGETITEIQKETGANIKMSKSNDFYPGTTERICLIQGPLEAVTTVHEFVMDKVREKPDPNPKPIDGDLKINLERHKQVKILVPNSTAGMIIGKSGVFIKQIKDETGAYVQISQKSKDLNLPERCVTVAGDAEQNKMALKIILAKISEDPQSGSCPNISYADYKGPVASSNPTGSPFATQHSPTNGTAQPPPQAPPPQNQPAPQMQPGNPAAPAAVQPVVMPTPQMQPVVPPQSVLNMNNSMNSLSLNANPAVEAVKTALRGNGFNEPAVEDIAGALQTLANYGFLGPGLGLGGMSMHLVQLLAQAQIQQQTMSMGGPLGGVPMAGAGPMGGAGPMAVGGGPMGQQAPPMPGGAGPMGGPGVIGNQGMGVPPPGGPMAGPPPPMPPQVPAAANMAPVPGANAMMPSAPAGEAEVFGPMGPNAATPMSEGAAEHASYFTPNSEFPNEQQQHNNGYGRSGNQNSFGLGMNGSFDDDEGATKRELEVGEYIVGAILGPGGRGIVEIQRSTGANIQISKKGQYAPGTKNRVVTVQASQPSCVTKAVAMIKQRVETEELKRARQGQR